MEKINYDLYKKLCNLGFSDKESRVYISLLELGRAAVSEIAKRASINRPTAYAILASLEPKGLVKTSGKKPKQEFIAESPEVIHELIRNEFDEVTKKQKLVQEIVPELSSIHSIKERPKILFYEGLSGLQTVYEDTLMSKEPIRAYATVDDMHKTLPKYFPEYYKRRTKKGITIRAIIPDTSIGRERKKYDKEELRETALVPADTYYFSPEINIYDNKVMIASWREKLGIIIESNEIADAMKKIYELAWNQAKNLDNKI